MLHYLLFHLIEQSWSFAIVHNLYPNKTHASLHYRKCIPSISFILPSTALYLSSQLWLSCSKSLKFLPGIYNCKSLKQCFFQVFSWGTFWKWITQGRLHFHVSPNPFFKTITYGLTLTSLISDTRTVKLLISSGSVGKSSAFFSGKLLLNVGYLGDFCICQ